MTNRNGGPKQAANIAKVSQGIYWTRQESWCAHFALFMRMMYCAWVLIFEEEQFSYNQITRPPRKIKKKWQFHSRFRGAFFAQYLKNISAVQTYLFPAVIRFVFRVFLELNLNCSPKMGDFSWFCRTKGLPNGHFLQCCHILIVFLFCLLLLLFFCIES